MHANAGRQSAEGRRGGGWGTATTASASASAAAAAASAASLGTGGCEERRLVQQREEGEGGADEAEQTAGVHGGGDGERLREV